MNLSRFTVRVCGEVSRGRAGLNPRTEGDRGSIPKLFDGDGDGAHGGTDTRGLSVGQVHKKHKPRWDRFVCSRACLTAGETRKMKNITIEGVACSEVY